MQNALFIFCFITSVGLSVFGLMTAYRLKNKENQPYASSLFYYVIFLVAFGFYSIWSYLGFQFLLNHVIQSHDTLLNIVGIFPFMGFPLIIVGWYLFIQFCVEVAGYKLKGYVSFLYFSLFILSFLFLGNHFKNQLLQNELYQFDFVFKSIGILHLLLVLSGVLLLLRNRKHTLLKNSIYSLPLVLFVPALFASASLLMSSSHWVAVLFFILFYFSHLALAPGVIYFTLNADECQNTDTFTLFCSKYEISKREAEIIQEICLGKTNQAIADQLFITVQTVKDHAHRIYSKTGVRNRVQLTNLVRETTKSEPV